MSYFPRSYITPDAGFSPLFRFLDEFDSYSRESQGNGRSRRSRLHRVPAFNPRFDVRETDISYELHGELPGIERDEVHIEFTEPQVIAIRGRTERQYTPGTPPAGVVDAPQTSGAVTDTAESAESHKATVSDEEVEEAKEAGTPTEDAASQVAPVNEQQKPAEKYWVSERSIGEFSRTFSFPSRVDQDAVTANLNNGVLHITIPKAKKHESRRIAIQ